MNSLTSIQLKSINRGTNILWLRWRGQIMLQMDGLELVNQFIDLITVSINIFTLNFDQPTDYIYF